MYQSTHIIGAQMMNPYDFGDHLRFPLVPPVSRSFHLPGALAQHLLI